MNCDDFVFSSKVNMTRGSQLNSTCGLASGTAFYYSDYFTGYDEIVVSFDTSSTSTAYLCTYDDAQGTNASYRTTLSNGNTYQLDPSKFYRVSTRYATNFSDLTKLRSCTQFTPIDEVKYKLNSIDSNDLYSDLSIMTPFIIFLIIFSFSYLVLKRVIRSSSRGDSNI